jgi:hypothetical protein
VLKKRKTAGGTPALRKIWLPFGMAENIHPFAEE